MTFSELFARGRQELIAGELSAASASLQAAVEKELHNSECWFLLGATRHRQDDLSAARSAFQRACEIDAQHLQARLALAAVCVALGDAAAATAVCREVVKLAPDNPESWFALGVAQEAGFAPEAALDAYDHALRLAPEHAGALKNRRAVWMLLWRFDEAIAQCRSAVARRPFSTEAQFALGETLIVAHRFAEAVQVLGRAASLSPGNARVALHYGFALAQIERFPQAQMQLDVAARIDPALVRAYRQSIFGIDNGDETTMPLRLGAHVLFLLRNFEQISRCDWSERDGYIDRFAQMLEESPNVPLGQRTLGFHAMVIALRPKLQLELARQIAAGIQAALPNAGPIARFSAQDKRSSARIRIGYLSADFRTHPVALLLGKALSWHDRSRFEVVAYSIGENDLSASRQEIVDSCDEFVDLTQMDDEAAACKIAADAIDVLIDLMGYTNGSRPGILARRPAPLQLAWLGYFATTGAPWIDYVLADDISLPAKLASSFSEAVIRLSHGVMPCSYAGLQLSERPSRASQGLPDDGMVLGALHSNHKIDPETFAVWMRLLAANPLAVLWLLDSGERAKSALCAAASRHGIAAERLIFAARVDHRHHLERLQLIDLVLDCPQYNGGATTADALVAGVPLLTCAGSTMMQRVAASLLHAAGQNDLVTADLEQYEQRAHELLSIPGRLAMTRKRLVEARTTAPFFRSEEWWRHLETGIQRAWDRKCAGLPAADIEVGE